MTSSLSHQLIYGSAAEDPVQSPSWFNESIRSLREGRTVEAYTLLSAYFSDCPPDLRADAIWLKLQCLDALKLHSRFSSWVKELASIVPPDDSRLLHAILQQLLIRNSPFDFLSVVPASKAHFHFRSFPHILISAIYSSLLIGNISQAQLLVQNLELVDYLPILMVYARLAYQKKDYELVESLLLPKQDQYISNVEYCELLIDSLFALRRESLCMPFLRKAFIYHHSLSSTLLNRFSEAKLLQRQPADGLRFKLLDRINDSICSNQQPPTCLSTAYDLLGRSEWFEHIHPEIIMRPGMCAHLASNLMMHLSSQAHSSYSVLATNFISFLRDQWMSLDERCILPLQNTRGKTALKIGWICGDICNHPVFRFIYSWFYASQSNKVHNHYVVSTHPVNPDYVQLLQNISDVSFIDLSYIKTMPEHLHAIRSLEFDVVIDLNGWTANNIAPVFLARVAPLQVNYLAYHASSALPSMDAWIVDDHLIPMDERLQEPHSEQLVRLQRPFLAWQPPSSLPEGKINNVPPISFALNSPIRFGCFNNTRKISDSCIKLWSELLEKVPGSSLVLKAFASEDSNTQQLLIQRFVDAGINLERINFLPFTSTPEEHLMQYAHMDVALDSFPNTGCTTTCEALWMGVPVISLHGDFYVTRMSHAVLCGVGLADWSFSNCADFIDFAQSLSEKDRLTWLRSNRSSWRDKLINSPLGNASDLMEQIESTLAKLYADKVSSLDTNAAL